MLRAIGPSDKLNLFAQCCLSVLSVYMITQLGLKLQSPDIWYTLRQCWAAMISGAKDLGRSTRRWMGMGWRLCLQAPVSL